MFHRDGIGDEWSRFAGTPGKSYMERPCGFRAVRVRGGGAGSLGVRADLLASKPPGLRLFGEKFHISLTHTTTEVMRSQTVGVVLSSS